VKVLVTGGTGFVGPNVVHALRARGHDVRALVRKPERAKTLEAWGCQLAQGDMIDPASLERAVRGCDAVVHLVAIIQGAPVAYRQIMEQGTRDLVTAAERARVGRFVLMSALGTNEQNRDLTPYFHAKWEMEQTVGSSGLEHVVFRPSFVFGKDGGVLPIFLRQVRLAPLTPVIGSGEERFQPIWVEDVAAFFAQSVDAPGAANKTFEIGGPEVVSWNAFYARVKKVLGVRRGTLHVPVGLARLGAAVVERLPKAPVTRDQLTMLTEAGDNVCDNGPALAIFDVDPVGLDEQIRRAA
jgi:NADH dehydrogenase